MLNQFFAMHHNPYTWIVHSSFFNIHLLCQKHSFSRTCRHLHHHGLMQPKSRFNPFAHIFLIVVQLNILHISISSANMSRVSLSFLVDSFPILSATSDAIVCLCCTRRPLCNAAFQVVHEDRSCFLPLSLSRLHKDFKQ